MGSSLASLRYAPIGCSIRYLFIIIVECLHGALPNPHPSPRFAPVRSRPSASLRDVPGRTARCPLPLPAGAFKHINSYLSTQLLCVRPLPPCKRFFFLCSVIHLVPCLATLRPGPRRAPSQRFSGCAHHKSNS